MSNKPHLRITDNRRGLVEITTGDGKVHLELYPPGRRPVVLPMLPDDARALARGLLEGADQAEAPGDQDT